MPVNIGGGIVNCLLYYADSSTFSDLDFVDRDLCLRDISLEFGYLKCVHVHIHDCYDASFSTTIVP